LRIYRLYTLSILLVFPLSLSATWYTIGTVADWRPKIENALRYVEVEYADPQSSMSVEERLDAIYVLAYLEGIRDGSWMFGAIALEKKYGKDTRLKPEHEIDEGFCLADPYDEILEKLDSYMAKGEYDDDAEFLVVLTNFLEEEYPCQ
jgi:hypothetical protein